MRGYTFNYILNKESIQLFISAREILDIMYVLFF